MPNYNNPAFEGHLTDIIERRRGDNPSDFFVIANNDGTGHSEGQYYVSSGTAYYIITKYAQQGFLLRLTVSASCRMPAQYGNPGQPGNFSDINFKFNETTGSFTFDDVIVFPGQSYEVKYTFSLTGLRIISYRKRYLRLTNTTLHPSSGGVSTYSGLSNIQVYSKSISSCALSSVFSILPDQGVFYTAESGKTYDAAEFPVYKDSNNNYGSNSTPGTAVSYLKIRGSHFLFDESNELQKRDFSLIGASDPNKGTSTSQIYSQIGSKVGSTGFTQAYNVKNDLSQIMHKKATFNQKTSVLNMPYYKYFNNDKSGILYYTDLGDNNTQSPSLSNPLFLYDNFCDKNESSILEPSTISSNLFWLDPYTLYFKGQIYFIPTNGRIGLLHYTGSTLSTASVDTDTSDPSVTTLRASASINAIGLSNYVNFFHPSTTTTLSTITVPKIYSSSEGYVLNNDNHYSSYSFTTNKNITINVSQTIRTGVHFVAGAYTSFASIALDMNGEQPFHIKYQYPLNVDGPIGKEDMTTNYALSDVVYTKSSGSNNFFYQNDLITFQISAFRPDGSRDSYYGAATLIGKLPRLNGICSTSYAYFPQFYSQENRTLRTFNGVSLPYYNYGIKYGLGTSTSEVAQGLEIQSDSLKDSYIIFIYQ